MCKNKNDLKACKMPLPNLDIGYGYWHPIASVSINDPPRYTCTPIDHPEYIMPFAQSVDHQKMTDNSQFYCLNRGDKNPFLITNDGSNGTSKTWTQWLNTSCPSGNDRRCLGSRPDICIPAIGAQMCEFLKNHQFNTANLLFLDWKNPDQIYADFCPDFTGVTIDANITSNQVNNKN